MTKTTLLLVTLFTITACTVSPNAEPRLRTQADVDRYNATVATEGEKLVCTRERVVGSNLPQLVCLTANQRERMAREASDVMEEIRR